MHQRWKVRESEALRGGGEKAPEGRKAFEPRTSAYPVGRSASRRCSVRTNLTHTRTRILPRQRSLRGSARRKRQKKCSLGSKSEVKENNREGARGEAKN